MEKWLERLKQAGAELVGEKLSPTPRKQRKLESGSYCSADKCSLGRIYFDERCIGCDACIGGMKY